MEIQGHRMLLELVCSTRFKELINSLNQKALYELFMEIITHKDKQPLLELMRSDRFSTMIPTDSHDLQNMVTSVYTCVFKMYFPNLGSFSAKPFLTLCIDRDPNTEDASSLFDKIIESSEQNDGSLIQEVAKGDSSVVKVLLESSHVFTINGLTQALKLAASKDDINMIKALLDSPKTKDINYFSSEAFVVAAELLQSLLQN